MWKISYTKEAVKALAKIQPKRREQIREKIDLLAENPHRQDLDTRKLQGRDGYRMRIGGWRVLYELREQQLMILVLRIEARGDGYK